MGDAGTHMLDAAGEYLESALLPAEEERASTGTVVGIVSLGAWTLIGVILLIEVL